MPWRASRDLAISASTSMHLNLHKTFSTPHGGGRSRVGRDGGEEGIGAFPTRSAAQTPAGRLALGLRSPRVHRPRPGIPRELRSVGTGAGVHHGAWWRRRLKRATLDALLNANYVRKLLEPHYEIAYHAPSMHECVFSDRRQSARGVSTGAIAKRLIDYGFHPYTVSFPLIVHGALMIEPTET